MPRTARNPIRVAAAAATALGLLAAACLPAGSSSAASSSTPPRTHRAVPAEVTLPGLQISGQMNTPIATTNTDINDTVTVNGDDGEDGIIISRLVGPVEPPTGATDCSGVTADQWANAPIRVEANTSIDGSVRGGNGTYLLGGAHMRWAGCYAWKDHLDLSSGATADTPPGLPAETTLLIQPQPIAAITPAWATVGSYLEDTLILAGTYGRTAQVTAEMVETDPVYFGRTPTCTVSPGQWNNPTDVGDIGPFTVTGDGPHSMRGAYQATNAGCYSFTYRVTLTVTPTTTATQTVTGTAVPGLPGNASLIDAPTITTAASSTPIDPTAGTANLADALTVTGLRIQPSEHATVTAQVLTAQPATNGCAGVDWANATKDGAPTTVDVTADGKYNTTPVGVQPGCHTFTETLTFNGQQVATGAEQPGQPAETVLITTAPTTSSTPPAPAGSTTPTDSPSPTSSSSPAVPSTSAAPTGSPSPTGTHSAAAPSTGHPATSTPVGAAPAVSGAQQLPFTGIQLRAAGGLALVLLLAGVALLVLARRPRHGRHRA